MEHKELQMSVVSC